MKPKEVETWKQTRAGGKLRYVILNGGSYGMAMFIAMTFFSNRNDLSPSSIAISAAIWSAGGLLFGLITWHVQESGYRKAIGGEST